MTAIAGTIGHTPKVVTGTGNPEAQKYGKLWTMEQYRHVAPGEIFAPMFLEQAKPKAGAKVIDFGCGTGRGGLYLAVVGELDVTFVDFVRNCLDEDVAKACEIQPTMRFIKADLEQPMPIAAQYGFCTDVMEHIPPDKVDAVLDNILDTAEHIFFAISTVPDHLGALIGETLHLTVQPFAWWMEQFAKRKCAIHWAKEGDGYALFYLSSWQKITTIMEEGKLNVEEEEIIANVKANCAAGWQQVIPHEKNDMEVMILGGGPSLNDHLEQIKEFRANGVKLITLNGSYNWAIEHGLTPSAQIMVDAREFNKRFTKPVVDECRYLIASQCHPSVLEGLPKDRTFLWHTMFDKIKDAVLPHYPQPYPVPSCSTVLNTSLPLLRMLGFTKFHLFGCDSCLAPDQMTHHAYDQPENDGKAIFRVSVTGGRVYWCHPWMAHQADQFIELIKFLGNEIELEIYGDGLLKGILDAGADAAITSEKGEI